MGGLDASLQPNVAQDVRPLIPGAHHHGTPSSRTTPSHNVVDSPAAGREIVARHARPVEAAERGYG
jgi:hypothetical protein